MLLKKTSQNSSVRVLHHSSLVNIKKDLPFFPESCFAWRLRNAAKLAAAAAGQALFLDFFGGYPVWFLSNDPLK